jgi:pyroglutamyl-peptidase
MPSPAPILLTAFDPFAGRVYNPSQQVVEAIAAAAHPWLLTDVLRTEFAYAGPRVRGLIARHRPAAVLMLGLHEGAHAVHLERVAVNRDAARIPDNAGDQPTDRPIAPDGPPTYASTLPLDALATALDARGIPWQFSDSAGTFVCNHAFYSAADEVARRGLPTRCGFVHVPDSATLPLPTLTVAVETCLNVLRSSTADDFRNPMPRGG